MKLQVKKRNGDLAPFDSHKIKAAITKGFLEFGDLDKEKENFITETTNYIEAQAKTVEEVLEVEEIQDIIVARLRKAGFRKVAKAYQEYREKRQKTRDMAPILEILSNEDTEEKTENGNVDGYTTMGRMLHVGEEIVKQHSLNNMFSQEVADAHRSGEIYIHDLGFASLGCTTCLQIPLDKLFKNGFSTGHGTIREPNSIMAAASLAAVAIQANQNEHHGGQSVPLFDFYLSPYVIKTYNKEIRKYLKEAGKEQELPYFDSIEQSREYKPLEGLLEIPFENTKRQTHQAMEAFIHNMCSLNSRAGSQVPFSSINFGLETDAAGRMVIEEYLKAHLAGLGRGETPIFPIAIFSLKKGVNFDPGDPNYDLFQLAMLCSSKRNFPTYSFLDASYNLPFYEKDPVLGTFSCMGCRTRVMSNVNGREGAVGRGNLSFATVNLPFLALEAEGKLEKFYTLLDKYMELTSKALLERYEVQKRMKVKNFPFLMGQKLYYNSDHLTDEDYVEDAIKNGTLSIGFIGLAETLTCLTGKHHGESEESQALGLEIVKHMRDYCDKKTQETQLNFSLLATPAETYCMKALEITKKKFGIVDGITDKEYFTNSSHIPVSFDISFKKKMLLEGVYHKYCNAGCIAYLEADGDISQNIPAFEKMLRTMSEADVCYGAINIPITEDPVCGFSGYVVGDICPKCGRDVKDLVEIKITEV